MYCNCLHHYHFLKMKSSSSAWLQTSAISWPFWWVSWYLSLPFLFVWKIGQKKVNKKLRDLWLLNWQCLCWWGKGSWRRNYLYKRLTKTFEMELMSLLGKSMCWCLLVMLITGINMWHFRWHYFFFQISQLKLTTWLIFVSYSLDQEIFRDQSVGTSTCEPEGSLCFQ